MDIGYYLISAIIILPSLGFLIYHFYRIQRLEVKKYKTAKHLKKAIKNDSLWDKKKLISITRTCFDEYQFAWKYLNFKDLAPYLTDEMKIQCISLAEPFVKGELFFHIGNYSYSSINIIDIKDSIHNDEDSFQAQVEFYAHRYIKNRFNELLPGHDMGYYIHRDILTFKRKDDTWLLSNVQFGITFFQAINSEIN